MLVNKFLLLSIEGKYIICNEIWFFFFRVNEVIWAKCWCLEIRIMLSMYGEVQEFNPSQNKKGAKGVKDLIFSNSTD